MILVILAIVFVAWLMARADFAVPQGPDAAQPVRPRGYTLLVNKYYLDDLYEKVIVAGISGPIARGRSGSTRT